MANFAPNELVVLFVAKMSDICALMNESFMCGISLMNEMLHVIHGFALCHICLLTRGLC